MTLTRAAFRRNNVPTFWIFAALVAAMVLPNVFMRAALLRVDSVHIYSAIEGNLIPMEVRRTIFHSFKGSYKVTIRHPSGSFVCDSSPVFPLTYRKGADLPVPLYLRWWLGGPDAKADCVTNGFGPGVYIAETCHYWIGPFGVELAQECVDSNKFVIYPRSILTEPLPWPFNLPISEL